MFRIYAQQSLTRLSQLLTFPPVLLLRLSQIKKRIIGKHPEITLISTTKNVVVGICHIIWVHLPLDCELEFCQCLGTGHVTSR